MPEHRCTYWLLDNVEHDGSTLARCRDCGQEKRIPPVDWSKVHQKYRKQASWKEQRKQEIEHVGNLVVAQGIIIGATVAWWSKYQ